VAAPADIRCGIRPVDVSGFIISQTVGAVLAFALLRRPD
jgi:hypothetical protein